MDAPDSVWMVFILVSYIGNFGYHAYLLRTWCLLEYVVQSALAKFGLCFLNVLNARSLIWFSDFELGVPAYYTSIFSNCQFYCFLPNFSSTLIYIEVQYQEYIKEYKIPTVDMVTRKGLGRYVDAKGHRRTNAKRPKFWVGEYQGGGEGARTANQQSKLL